MTTEYDVIVVGGGMVGASLVCALQNAGLRVAIIEAFAPDADLQPSFDERTIALTYSSRDIFSALGAWDEIASGGEAHPILAIDVSDRGQAGHCRLSHRDVGVDALGYVVPTRVVGTVLHGRIASADGVSLFCPAQVERIERHDDYVEAFINQDESAFCLRSRLLVLADGGRSPLREQLGYLTKKVVYKQAALITTLRSDRPHEGLAYERFVGSGPLALLPMNTHDFAAVWTLDADTCEAYREMPEDRFLSRLQTTFGRRAGNFDRLASRKLYPLMVERVDQPSESRIVAIGNAAHVVHPVAGQGFNLGLKDVADLADLVRSAQAQGLDIGDRSLLRRYARRRRRETRNVLRFTDGMISVFSSDFAPLVIGRNIGLLAVENLPFLRRALLRRTMGIHGRQARLPAVPPPAGDNGSTSEFDIVIAGAGLIGAALACRLGDTGLRVAILDRSPPPDIPTGPYDLRINAYNRAAEQTLRACGAWDRLPGDRIFPFRHVRVCNSDGDGAVSFSATDVGESHLGYFIENVLVTRILLDRAAEMPHVELVTDAEIRDIAFRSDRATIYSETGESYSGRLLVGSDGAESRVRAAAGIGVRRRPYAQKCIVGTIEFDGDHRETAWQRFLPTGPLGLLPLAPGYCSLAWSCEEHLAARLMQMNDTDFIGELDDAIRGYLGTITGIGRRGAFPLVARDASTYVAERIALIGDAAHVIHPLAGLGANIGFQDVEALATLVSSAAMNPRADLGGHSLLRRYERRRHGENRIVMSTMSAFNDIFSNDNEILGRIRNAGLAVADRVNPAKNFLMRRAMWMSLGPARD